MNKNEEIRFEFVQYVKDLGLENDLKLPERSTANSAGYDFFCTQTTSINPNEIQYVKTGVKAYFPADMYLGLYNRSSNPKKKGLILINGVGIVDSDYVDNPDNEGDIAFAFYNMTNERITIEKGEKLGQGIFSKFHITANDQATNQRISGFGSTGE